MTLQQLINKVDDRKPNAYDTETKIDFINACEGLIYSELLRAKFEPYTMSDLSRELQVKPPYDDMYTYYLMSQLDVLNEEFDLYNNHYELFNKSWDRYAKWLRSFFKYQNGELPDIKGPKGDAGPQGLQGEIGPTGPQGEIGLQGPKGDTGLRGEIGPKGDKGSDGKDGSSVRILGKLNNTSELPTNAELGDGYLINGELHTWNGNEWTNVGNIKGPKGDKGDIGPQGPQGPQGEGGTSINDGITETTSTWSSKKINDKTSAIEQNINGYKFYKSVSEIGLTTSATMEEIATKMQNKSILITGEGFGSNVPTKYGTLIVTKQDINRVALEWNETGDYPILKKYYGHFRNLNTAKPFGGWYEIGSRNKNDLINIVDAKTETSGWSDAIQFILDRGYNCYIPSGEYLLNNTILARSNTKIVMESGAVLYQPKGKRVLTVGFDTNVTGYNGVTNFAIEGGKIVGELKDGTSIAYPMIALFHSTSISFNGVTFQDVMTDHTLDICACKGVLIEGCSFKGVVGNIGTESECIQIDKAQYRSLGSFGTSTSPCYDGTMCQDIYIKSCYFGPSEKYQTYYILVGQHSQGNTNNKHSNIKFVNNVCDGRSEGTTAFRVMQMQDVCFDCNVFNNIKMGVVLSTLSEVGNNQGVAVGSQASYLGSRNIKVVNNTFNLQNSSGATALKSTTQTSSGINYNVFFGGNVITGGASSSMYDVEYIQNAILIGNIKTTATGSSAKGSGVTNFNEANNY